MTIILALAAATLGEAIEHRIVVPHPAGNVAATYRARVALDVRTQGAHTPNRPSRQTCRWTATVDVERAFDGMAPRIVASDRTLKGSRPGACDTARPAIEAEVAARTPAVRDRLIAAAEADRSTLLAEIEALRPNG